MRNTPNQKKQGFLLAVVCCSLMFATSCNKNYDEPQNPNSPVQDQQEATLRLRVSSPNEVILRAAEEADAKTDPMTTIKKLRFAFYKHTGEAYQVSVVKEQNISSPSELENLKLILPADNYKLVAIANPSPRLTQLTSVGMPLDSMTQAIPMRSKDFRVSNNIYDGISMLNEQGPVAIPAESFSEGTLPTKVVLESSLARVLVYGNPELAGGTRGNAKVGYVITNLMNKVAPLRPLGKLISGQDELTGDQSLKQNRYASSPIWEAWRDAMPKNTADVGHFTPEMYALPQAWNEVAISADTFKGRLGEANLYAKESVVPPTAYAKGLTPAVVLAYPYIPRGLSLQEDEGWVAFQGLQYGERQFKQILSSRKFPNQSLANAVDKAAITTNSFTQSFDKEGIRFYHKAINYYVIYIKHFSRGRDASERAPGRFGVVRGNEYRIRLVSITDVGVPVAPTLDNLLEPISESAFTGIGASTKDVVGRDQNAQL